MKMVFYSFWLAVGLVPFVIGGADLLAAEKPLGEQAASPMVVPESYVRLTRSGSNLVQLQIAVRKFVPARGRGPTVWLAAVSHLGESNYFRALQKHLDAQSLVLFEGISEHHEKGKAKRSKASAGNAAKDGAAEPEISSLQQTLAESLGLAFQLNAIDYSRSHFQNSDLSISDIQRLMQSGSKDAAGADAAPSQEFTQLLQVMDESSWLGTVMVVVAKLLGSSPKLQGMSKLAIMETVSQVKGDISQLKGMPPEFARLVKVLIDARNQAVMQDLKVELKKKVSPKSISILYGAGHMEDMEKRMQSELKYRPADHFWLTAFSVNLEESGLTEADIQMIRGIIQWQMELLQR